LVAAIRNDNPVDEVTLEQGRSYVQLIPQPYFSGHVVKFDITKLNPRSRRLIPEETQTLREEATLDAAGECDVAAEILACETREAAGVAEITERGAGGFGSTDDAADPGEKRKLPEAFLDV
jgi:hypothetical protein